MSKYLLGIRIFQAGIVAVLVFGLLAFVLPALLTRHNNVQTKKGQSQVKTLGSIEAIGDRPTKNIPSLDTTSVVLASEAAESSASASLSATPRNQQGLPAATTSAEAVIITEKPVPPSPYDTIFQEEAKKYKVPLDLLRKIAYCETHFNSGAQNGSYGGMFQFTEDTWRAARQEMGADPDPRLRFGIKESIETAAWKISQGGVGAWLNCSK